MTFCLHFIIKSISIPPALPPFHLFILLLLVGDINPNPGPSDCPKITYANVISIHNKYPAIAKLFQTMTLTSLPCRKLGLDLIPQLPNCPKSLYQVTICIMQPREVRCSGGLGFFVKDGLDRSVVPTKTCTTFKNLLIKISLNKESLIF